MIHHYRPQEIVLPRVRDPRYVGNSISCHKTVHATSDGVLEFGLWRFSGEHVTPVHTGYDEALMLLEGTLTVDSDDGSFEVGPGETLIYECPVPPQRLSSPEGIVAAYVIRRRPDQEPFP